MAERVLFIGGNFSPEPTGIGKYSGEMIEWMAKKGHLCTVITTYPYYPQWKLDGSYKSSRWYTKEEINVPVENNNTSGKIIIYRCPHYIPNDPSGKARILHDLSFFLSAFFPLLILLFKKKHTFVLNVTPPLLPGLLAVLYKKIRKAKFICHIQDLQVDAADKLKLIKQKALLKGLFKIEKYILKNADIVSSISSGMIAKIEAKTNKPVVFFPNWSDVNLFFPINNKSALKQEFGFKPNDKVILHSGAIGVKQGLEAILCSAKHFKGNENVKFVICGMGPYREKLKETAVKMELTNLFFPALQPLEKFNRFLNMADLHLVIQKIDASDLVMPSKLTNILAVGGTALVTANPGTSLFELIEKNKMGLLTDAENQEALNEGIKLGLDNAIHEYNENARNYALENLSIEQVMNRFLQNAEL